jgi:hypothetical protein
VIVEDIQRDVTIAAQRVDKSGDRPVADALDAALDSVDDDCRGDAPLASARLRKETVVS